jgi:hypothetical protein
MSYAVSDYDGDTARDERKDALACEQYAASRMAAFDAGLVSYANAILGGPRYDADIAESAIDRKAVA